MSRWFALVAFFLAAAAVPAQTWSPAQEAQTRALLREGGFYPALSKVVRGEGTAALLAPWLARLEEPSLVGTTVRDTLASLPAAVDAWLVPALSSLAPGPERDWVLDRRRDPARVPGGKFHLSLFPVRMDLLSGVSMILPNYDWSISYQDPGQMTVQALEKGYSATVHLRWITPKDTDVFDTARLVQLYAGFRPRYIVAKPAGEAPVETDLVPLPAVDPLPLAGRPEVLEQVQTGRADAWQLYAGRTRWFPAGDRVLVVLVSVHVERDQRLADLDRLLTKLGLLLDTVRLTR